MGFYTSYTKYVLYLDKKQGGRQPRPYTLPTGLQLIRQSKSTTGCTGKFKMVAGKEFRPQGLTFIYFCLLFLINVNSKKIPPANKGIHSKTRSMYDNHSGILLKRVGNRNKNPHRFKPQPFSLDTLRNLGG